MKHTFLLSLFISLVFNLEAKVELPSLIQNNMVLQQNSMITLWGKASPNHKIKITPSWSSSSVNTNSDKNGYWEIKINTSKAGGPYSISFNDGQETKVENILLGEVWLCAGQSNMELPLMGNMAQPVLGSLEEIVKAKESTPLRFFTVERRFSKEPLTQCNGKWLMNNSKNVSNFSATAYYFGKYLQEVLDVPVGLICSSVGGSKVQAWMSDDILKLFPNVDTSLLKEDLNKLPDNKKILTPTLLFNGMMNPLKNVTFKGIIWYQGEANKKNCKEYEELFPSFVKMTRDFFSSNLPFYYAQIAPFGEFNNKYMNTVLMRETQAKLMNKIPNCGMAILTDKGTESCIHPPYKKEAGERLAYWALAKTYNRDGFVYQSPTYKEIKIENNKAYLHFDNAPCGLTDYHQGLNLFEIAGEDKKFYPANAKITKDNYQVIVWSDQVKAPVAVRYAFKNYVKGDLFGISGLPVSSFRTDNWDILNGDKKKK